MPPKKLSGYKNRKRKQQRKEESKKPKKKKKKKLLGSLNQKKPSQSQLTENNSQLQLSLDSGKTSASSFEEIPANLNNQQPKTNLELTIVSEQNFKYNDPGTYGHLNQILHTKIISPCI